MFICLLICLLIFCRIIRVYVSFLKIRVSAKPSRVGPLPSYILIPNHPAIEYHAVFIAGENAGGIKLLKQSGTLFRRTPGHASELFLRIRIAVYVL